MSSKTSDLAIVTTLADTDFISFLSGNSQSGYTNKRIAFSDLKKQLGSSTSAGGSTGTTNSTTNLFQTPTNLSKDGVGKWVDYSQSGGLNRPGGARIVITAGTTTSNVIYESFNPTITTAANNAYPITAGKTYTFGATVTRAANTGSGAVRTNTYYEGNQTNAYGSAPTVTDGTPFTIQQTFTMQSGQGNIHIGFDFTPGGGDFSFSNITLVEGTSYNPSATASA